MKKQILIGALILVFGVGIGFSGGWFKFAKWPEQQAQKLAREQQEQMDKMVRSGETTFVQADAISVKVEKGGGDIGQTMKYRINEFTKIQIGTGFVNNAGEKADLTQWFKEGEYVNLLVSDGQAVLIHRELRPEEANSTSNIEEEVGDVID